MSNDEYQQRQFFYLGGYLISFKSGEMNYTVVWHPLLYGPIEQYINNINYTIKEF